MSVAVRRMEVCRTTDLVLLWAVSLCFTFALVSASTPGSHWVAEKPHAISPTEGGPRALRSTWMRMPGPVMQCQPPFTLPPPAGRSACRQRGGPQDPRHLIARLALAASLVLLVTLWWAHTQHRHALRPAACQWLAAPFCGERRRPQRGDVLAFRPSTCLEASRRSAGAPAAGPKVEVLIAGRSAGQEDWMVEACNEYEKRLRPSIRITTLWLKGEEQLLAEVAQHRCGICVCLDENGREMTSKEFAAWLYLLLEEGGSRCTFVIGGADGLPAALRPESSVGSRPVGVTLHHVALSRLTFTHQLARVVLMEQLYRASQIRHGTKYHRS
eukprot:GGOE01017833.1.p1 GENE.GGOE01017833.1~~GGOE01017833.1.p1  ORF type:complete len:328 (+),score=42.49 GGOE01017833.1:99-1082(+)